MAVHHTDVLLEDTETTTGPVDLSDLVAVAIHVPTGFDGTAIAIEGALTVDGDYYPVCDAAGTPLVITAAAETIAAVAPDATRGVRYAKFVSDAAQTADITLRVACLPDDRA